MWTRGEVIVCRQVVNDGRPWFEIPLIVVEDAPELLVTYTAPGAPFSFPPGRFPTSTGRNPYHGRTHWEGNGMLALHRPGEWHAINVFWHGSEREFSGWYVNIQEPFRRTESGFDTQDLELDIWIPNRGPWEWKDAELLDLRVAEGRYTREQVELVRTEGDRIAAELDAGRHWWDAAWAQWAPDPAWPVPAFPAGYPA